MLTLLSAWNGANYSFLYANNLIESYPWSSAFLLGAAGFGYEQTMDTQLPPGLPGSMPEASAQAVFSVASAAIDSSNEPGEVGGDGGGGGLSSYYSGGSQNIVSTASCTCH
jgi:hypothetical protein